MKKVYELIKLNYGYKRISRLTGVSQSRVKTLMRNFNDTFFKCVNLSTGEVSYMDLNKKHMICNILFAFNCYDNNSIIEVFNTLKMKISKASIAKYKKQEIIVPYDLTKFEYLEERYSSCLGKNKYGFISNKTFYGTRAEVFLKYQDIILDTAIQIQVNGWTYVYNDVMEKFENKDTWKEMQEKFYSVDIFSYYLFPLSKVVASCKNGIYNFEKVKYIYYKTKGCSDLTDRQCQHLQKQIDEEVILIPYIFRNGIKQKIFCKQ